MEILNYDPKIREFHYERRELLTYYGSRKDFFFCYAVHDYYPKNHFGNEVDANILKVRNKVKKKVLYRKL